LTIEQDDE